MLCRTAAVAALLLAAGVAHASEGGVRGAAIGEVRNETWALAATHADPEAATHADPEAWMVEFCSAKCRAAGYCCNDYRVGSNQMISCAQACMMRARGSTWQEMAAANGGLCDRTGASGCSLVVNRKSYGFCSRCSDLTDSPKCKWGVASSDACHYGASLSPSPEDYCAFSCQSAGYCCNDYKVGSNQMISCAQACMMRTLGASLADMTQRRGLCDRNGASGCSLAVGGRWYSFCSQCSDLTDRPQCKWGVAGSYACYYGAALPPSSWGFKA